MNFNGFMARLVLIKLIFSFVKRIFTDTPLNEDLKHPLVPATFYNIFRDAEEGYVSCLGNEQRLIWTDHKFVSLRRLTTRTPRKHCA